MSRIRSSRVALVIAVFLAIWSIKLATISRYGTDVPYWDQWGKEGDRFFMPWFEHHQLWGNLLVPHNEHRIAPTLLLNFGLMQLADKQWDARIECIANAALHALLMAALAAWALRRFPTRWAVALSLMLVLVAAPPIAWENVLGGFQSVFYFLMIFSLLALGGLLGAPAGSWRWFGGIAAAAVAAVSMGSGMLVGVPIAMIAAARLLRREHRRGAIATLIAGALIFGIGWWFRPQAPWHNSIHAHSVGQYVMYVIRCLSWPLYDSPWLALLWVPWLWFAASWAATAFRSRSVGASTGDGTASSGPATESQSGGPGSALAEFILAGGLWILLQVAAVSFARAGTDADPAPRYGDLFALGLVFNVCALIWFGVRARPRRTARRIAPCVLWAAVLVLAVGVSTRQTIERPLPKKKREVTAYERNTHAFVLTDNYAILEKAQKADELPFPIIDWFARILRSSSIRPILPASIAAPIPVPGLDNHRTGSVPLPALDGRPTRTVTAGNAWTSAPLPPGRGWWKIETAGDLGSAGASLQLVSVSDHRVLARIAPSKHAGNSWRAAYVHAPSEPAVLHARVDAPAAFVAFTEPIRMSSLSFWSWRLVEHAGWVAVLGFGALILSARAVWRTRPTLPA